MIWRSKKKHSLEKRKKWPSWNKYMKSFVKYQNYVKYMTLFNQTIINRTNQKTKMFFYSPVQVSDERRKDIPPHKKISRNVGNHKNGRRQIKVVIKWSHQHWHASQQTKKTKKKGDIYAFFLFVRTQKHSKNLIVDI